MLLLFLAFPAACIVLYVSRWAGRLFFAGGIVASLVCYAPIESLVNLVRDQCGQRSDAASSGCPADSSD